MTWNVWHLMWKSVVSMTVQQTGYPVENMAMMRVFSAGSSSSVCHIALRSTGEMSVGLILFSIACLKCVVCRDGSVCLLFLV